MFNSHLALPRAKEGPNGRFVVESKYLLKPAKSDELFDYLFDDDDDDDDDTMRIYIYIESIFMCFVVPHLLPHPQFLDIPRDPITF